MIRCNKLLKQQGCITTTLAGGVVSYLPGEPKSAESAPTALGVGKYLYPVFDATGTVRMWADASGNIISRSALGPYGEDLGYFPGPRTSMVGFAGYPGDKGGSGLWHMPNRSLTNQGRFLSVDPSGTLNLHDPRTFNQYAYVAGNPLMYIDPAGLNWFNIEGIWEWHEGETYAGIPSEYTHLMVVTTKEIRADGSKIYEVSVWNQNQRMTSLDSTAYSGGALDESGAPSPPIANGNYLIRADLHFEPPVKVQEGDPEHNPPPTWGIQEMGLKTKDLVDPSTGLSYDVEAAYGSMRARLIPISPGIDDKYFLHGQRGDYYLLKRTHGCLTTVTDDRILNYLFNLNQRIPVAINMPVRYPQ